MLTWFKQPHVNKHFYGQGLSHLLNSIDSFLSRKPTLFLHWLAFDEDTPFAYLATSQVKVSQDLFFRPYCSPKAEAFTLDLLIGNSNYLGKGLASFMIESFIKKCLPNATDIFIDPNIRNEKAIHVYEKAGFKKIKLFEPDYEPGCQNLLMHKQCSKD